MQENEGKWGNKKKKKNAHTLFCFILQICEEMLTGFFLFLTPPPPDGQTRRGLDGAQAHPRHQHARSRRARESVHGECTLPRSPPLVTQAGDRSVSPPAGQQDQDPQAAGRAGGDAE